jgi:hypothetical protein
VIVSAPFDEANVPAIEEKSPVIRAVLVEPKRNWSIPDIFVVSKKP